jgi:hypothetical protein
MASANDRIRNALAMIEEVAGEDEREEIEGKLNPGTRATYGDLLALGGFRGGIRLIKSSTETRRRNLVRAILLAQLVLNKVPVGSAQAQRTMLISQPAETLERQLRHLFPYKPFRGRFAKRAAWNPDNFTDPNRHTDSKFMYLIHTIMGRASKVAEMMTMNPSTEERTEFEELRRRYIGYATVDRRNPRKANLEVRFYEEYLDDPSILQKNIISSSIINQNKVPTYYPFGFIMCVPLECIYITSPKDVGVSNRTPNILFELDDKQKKAQSQIYTPAEILAQTSGRNSDTGYNEIVVIGTSPEGRQVEVTGISVKTDGKGNMFMRNGMISKDVGEPYVNAEIQDLIKRSSRKHRLPIVPIRDTSSGVSTTPWPFGEVRPKVWDGAFRGPATTSVRPRRGSI